MAFQSGRSMTHDRGCDPTLRGLSSLSPRSPPRPNHPIFARSRCRICTRRFLMASLLMNSPIFFKEVDFWWMSGLVFVDRLTCRWLCLILKNIRFTIEARELYLAPFYRFFGCLQLPTTQLHSCMSYWWWRL